MTAERPKKGLLVITQLFLPTKGGTAVWFDEVYPRIGGKEIHILTEDVDGAADYDKSHRNTVHRIGLKRYWWLRPESLAMYLKLLVSAVKIMLGHHIDAVHAGRVLPEGLVGLVVARLFRKPLVIYAHGEEITTWRQSGKFKAMKFTYKHADQIVANSEFTQNELIKIGVDPTKIVRISPGVDINRFRPGLAIDDLRCQLGLTGSEKLVLSVGRLSRRKGFDQVIRALRELRDQQVDVHFALIGIGEDRDYLGQLVAEQQLQQQVHFLGHVPAEDLPRWYNAADLFVMPNREINGDTEGFGMVFLEASACGTPVIAGQAGGTGSAVIEGVTGFRVDGNDKQAIVDAIRSLLTDTEEAAKMALEARLRTKTDYSWERIAEKTIDFCD